MQSFTQEQFWEILPAALEVKLMTTRKLGNLQRDELNQAYRAVRVRFDQIEGQDNVQLNGRMLFKHKK